MGAVVVEREVHCASDAASLWCHISDTERLNRAIGLGRIELTPNDDETAARYLVATVSGGFPIEYEERPYEWVENERFKVRRVLRKGLFRSMENVFELEPTERGTTVRVRIVVEPKVGMLAPVVRFQVKRFLARIAHEVERIDASLAAGQSTGFSTARSQVDLGALERAGRTLSDKVGETRQAAAQALIGFIAEASDPDVDRVRPYELADALGIDRRLMLSTCLDAVVSGLLELCWDLVCPSCRTASERLRSLAELTGEGHCQLCELKFESDLDRSVEATFRPASAVRRVDGGPYCIGGPARVPHVAVQAILPPKGEIELRGPMRLGKYKVFVRGGASGVIEVAPGGIDALGLTVAAGTIVPDAAVVGPRARITIDHLTPAERHVKIERLEWDRSAATAHQVSMLPEFRRLFASETLRPGVSLRVARVALLFTDLTNSTAMYQSLGDASAFRIVQEHFQLLSSEVERAGGTLVKTIGDAVMAAFRDDHAALDAALAMHRAMRAFREKTPRAHEAHLKIGVYAGPCYAVTANGLLDYFGSSVNVAARLQNAAGAGELVVPAELAELAEREGWLVGSTIAERFEARLKGLPPLSAARLVVDPPAPS